jgi:phospholipid/cholesterol/gamma-HCH transport system substrate-binding protein
MAVEKSYARLGFFIVLTLVLLLVTAVFFIQRLKKRPAIGMVTYTTDNVFGLDVSSAVRLRGVPVGRVTAIRVDPRGTIVQIDFEVFLDRLNTIGLDVSRLRTITDVGGVFPNLRAQLMGNPLTGEAYLLLDQPENPPPPMELAIKPNRPYVPSVTSPFELAQDRLPALLDRANATLLTLREIVARMPDSLDRSDRFFDNTSRIMRESELPTLSADSRKFFATTSAQIEQMRSDMDGVIGSEGSLVKFSEDARAAIKAADLPAATQAAREAADNSRLAADDLRRTLPAIRDSLQELRELSRMLEEQPESLVYGPRPPEKKHQ